MHQAQTLDDLHRGGVPSSPPSVVVLDEGFFVIKSGARREFGWCCGQLGWSWRYTRWLIHRLDDVAAMTKRCP